MDEPLGYYIIGGTDGKKPSNKALKFDPSNNSLILATTFEWKDERKENNLFFAAPTVIKDSQDLYIFGG